MFRAGDFVSDHVVPADDRPHLDDDQVQPNGVDLTLAGVAEPTEAGRIGREGKRVANRRRLAADGDEYRLSPGGYVAEYAERVAIPQGHIGFVLPRSSLLRNGAMIETAVWDTGYEGRGEGLLHVHNDLVIERGARFAQFVLARADHEGEYDGDYQGERL